jgi:hypothetical protein
MPENVFTFKKIQLETDLKLQSYRRNLHIYVIHSSVLNVLLIGQLNY